MEYLRSCFAALMPVKAARAPQYADVEAYGCAGEQSIVIVTEAADVRVLVSPLLRTHDLYDVVNGV